MIPALRDALVSLDAEFERPYGGTAGSRSRRSGCSGLRCCRRPTPCARSASCGTDRLLFRWFIGLGIDDAVWDHAAFLKNRDRLLVPPEAGKGGADVAAKLLEAVLRHLKVKRFLSDDHFSVDSTLAEAWASLKSFRAKGRQRRTGLRTERDPQFPRRKARQRHARE
jgi:hypothetical protein